MRLLDRGKDSVVMRGEVNNGIKRNTHTDIHRHTLGEVNWPIYLFVGMHAVQQCVTVMRTLYSIDGGRGKDCSSKPWKASLSAEAKNDVQLHSYFG